VYILLYEVVPYFVSGILSPICVQAFWRHTAHVTAFGVHFIKCVLGRRRRHATTQAATNLKEYLYAESEGDVA
jgi:hypothetical protein